tara:strand:- start:10314 stop:10544 length:231 start_codon:yes stop_codon:yes gene_type:complete
MDLHLIREIYESLIKKYENEIQTCKSTLFIYFEHPVGIGDHSNHISEMDNLISNMASANDKLNMIKAVFKERYSKL